MSRYIYFTTLKHLIFWNGGSIKFGIFSRQLENPALLSIHLWNLKWSVANEWIWRGRQWIHQCLRPTGQASNQSMSLLTAHLSNVGFPRHYQHGNMSPHQLVVRWLQEKMRRNREKSILMQPPGGLWKLSTVKPPVPGVQIVMPRYGSLLRLRAERRA
jgi:hypothetical protein